MKIIKGKLKIIKRLQGSINGNPRYLVTVDGIECRTCPDSSLGYAITNYDNKEVSAEVKMHYNNMHIFTVEEVTR